MLIKVTEEHIREGKKESYGNCPLALAIKEALGREVGIVEEYCRVFNKASTFGSETKVYFPRNVTEFIKAFDSGTEVKPFEFELEY